MRDRAWRRYVEERIVIRRLKRLSTSNSWWVHIDANGVHRENPKLKDFIGLEESFMFKTYTTDEADTRYKAKYSPNKGDYYWRSTKKSNGSTGKRESDKVNFFKLLKEYGIK